MLLCVNLQVAFVQQNKNIGQSPKRKVIKMKKFASVLLAVLVAFSMFSFVVSAAAPKLTVSADKTNVKAGDTVTVTVKLAEKSGLGVLTFKVNYDSSVLEATKMEAGDLGATVNVKTGIATMATATTFEAAGTVCTMTFKALKDGEANVTLDVTEAYDANLNEVTVEKGSVKVTVGAGETTTAAPETTTAAPETTTAAPETTTQAPETTEHVCTWSSWAETKAPTCQAEGVKTRNCTVCGEAETEAVAKVDCAYKWVVTKEATATAYGEKALKCTMCGDVKETQKLALKTEGSGAGTTTKPVIPGTDAIA
jgi:hypothetical protein